jgi:hypothetical protein
MFLVAMIAHGIREANQIQPIHRHPLAEMLGSQ